MGCFNLKGFFSNVSIQCGDEIVMMIGLQKDPYTRQYYTCQGIVPITLPIYGRYDDYGGIEDVKDTPSSQWIEEHLGNIDDVVRAVDECMEIYNPTIKQCMDSDNECHPETKVRYVYDNFLKLKSFDITEDSHLCLLVEHRSIYEKYAVPPKNDTWFSVDKVMEEAEQRAKTLRSIMGDHYIKHIFNNYNYIQRMFGNDSHGVLSAMISDDEKFLIDNIEEVKRLQGFILSMESFGRSFQVPMQYSQCDYFKADLEYHKMCIDLIETLKEKYDWYDEEDEEIE